MATMAEVIATARWQARQHMDGDLLTVAQWHECLARAWRRLWNLHPEAFHVDGELVGERPELPDVADAAAVLPISDEWLDVVGAAVAVDALAAVVATEDVRQELAATVLYLDGKVIRGVG
jgi:hypothetical protein